MITNDKDFGELAIRTLSKTKGIIIFRLKEQAYKKKEKALQTLIQKFSSQLENAIIII